MTLKVSNSIDPLTDEQIKKRAIGVENVDYNGLVKRHRVLGQTIFDMLFLQELISQSQHEAAHLFMDSMANSGANIPSANLETEVFTAPKDIGNIIGERRMAFSSAYRFVVRECGDDRASKMMKTFENVYTYTADASVREEIAMEISPALDALASFYGVAIVDDPRDLVRLMVGARKRKRGRGRSHSP